MLQECGQSQKKDIVFLVFCKDDSKHQRKYQGVQYTYNYSATKIDQEYRFYVIGIHYEKRIKNNEHHHK